MRYDLKFSGTRFLSLKIKITQFPDEVRLYIRPQVAFEEIIGSLSNDLRRQRERQKSKRFRLAKQQLCTCITLFVHFLAVVALLQREIA